MSELEENNEMQEKESNSVKGDIAQKAAKEGMKKLAKNPSLMAAAAHIIVPIAIIVVILIIIGGIILFLLTMPGMVMEQLKKLAKEIADGLFSWFGGDKTTLVDDSKIYETLDYLEEMGYDLKGYGFLTDYVTNMEDIDEDKYNKDNGAHLDDEMGVIRDDDNHIIYAESDYILNYMISDNYVYTLANKNAGTQEKVGGFWSKVWGGIKAVGLHIYDFFGGETPNSWTRGLLNIWEEGKEGIGTRGGFYSDTGFLNFDNMEINVASKTLSLKKSAVGNGNASMEYKLDGWTGRYGMPLEFLLSIHVATMMPDLAYDMANSFNTKINILLHQVTEADALAGFKVGEDNYVTYTDIDAICGGFIDSWFVSSKEAMQVLKELGIKSPENCTGAHKEGYGTEEVDGVKSNTKSGDKGVESYNETFAKMKELGYTGEMPDSISGQADLDSQLQDITEEKNKNYNPNNGYASNYEKYEYYYNKEETITWVGKSENGEDCTYSITITIKHYNQTSKTGYTGGQVPSPIEQKGAGEVFSITTSKITRNWTESEWNEELEQAKSKLSEEELKNKSDAEILGTMKCSDSTDEFTEACDNCKKYIKNIYDALKTPNDKDFDYYIPYIENVTDHWYRDVYFTENHYNEDGEIDGKTINFVDYDYEYEAVMNERWTKYEADKQTGEYKLYAIDKDGNYATSTDQIENYDANLLNKDGNYYIFNGTQEEAQKDEIAVSKKAETLTTSDAEKLEDLGWSKNEVSGVWTAYEEKGDNITSWEPVYPDDEDEIKKNIYVKITSKSGVSQVGEGQRTETNQKIKKMFLQNKYLKYDGTPEKSEEITKLRKDKSLEYGALTSTDENVQKYASKVALNQDSLNAFNMLENTHTLDADYIYRDFKELVVELGYFTKEELTDETPRLLQWIVPEIGSGGYPERTIDKNENEFGTMVHSNGDIEANRKNTLQSIIAAAIADASNETSDDSVDDTTKKDKATQATGTANESKLDMILAELDEDFSGNQFVSLGTGNETGTDTPKQSTTTKSSSSGSGSLLSLDEWWEETQKMFDVYKSEGWLYDGHGANGAGESHGCNAQTTFDEVHDGGREKTTDCSIGASWMLQKLGALQDNHTFTSYMGDSGGLDESNPCAKDLLEAGAEVIVPVGGTKFTATATGGQLEPGDVLFYSGHVSIYCGDSYEGAETTFCWDTGSTSGIQGGGPKDTSWEDRDIKLIIRLPLGNQKSSEDSYVGYMGNEAVVSPVTGILLDYGIYTDEDKSSITDEKYRQNVDLKYMKQTEDTTEPDPNNTQTNNGTNNTNEPAINPSYDPEKPDKVGYAKILVLDAESYKKLESQTENPWKNKSLLNMKDTTDEEGNKVFNVNYDETTLDDWLLDKESRLKDKDDNGEDDDPWTEIAKTVYGYKEFAERYEIAGLSGYVVYIDGFKCEKPDEEFSEEKLETESPNKGKESEQEITLETFKEVKPEDLAGTDLTDE